MAGLPRILILALLVLAPAPASACQTCSLAMLDSSLPGAMPFVLALPFWWVALAWAIHWDPGLAQSIPTWARPTRLWSGLTLVAYYIVLFPLFLLLLLPYGIAGSVGIFRGARNGFRQAPEESSDGNGEELQSRRAGTWIRPVMVSVTGLLVLAWPVNYGVMRFTEPPRTKSQLILKWMGTGYAHSQIGAATRTGDLETLQQVLAGLSLHDSYQAERIAKSLASNSRDTTGSLKIMEGTLARWTQEYEKNPENYPHVSQDSFLELRKAIARARLLARTGDE